MAIQEVTAQEAQKISEITSHFKPHEFQCPCCGACDMDKDFLIALNYLRDQFGKPLKINSGFRCKIHNERIGGKPNSFHLIGKACDINIAPFYQTLKFDLFLTVLEKFNGVGIAHNFMHVDTRAIQERGLWFY